MPLIILLFTFAVSPPTDLRAIKIINNDSISITLAWERSKDDQRLDGYEIFRSRYRLIGSLVQDSIFIDEDLMPEEEYQYDVVKKEVLNLRPKIDPKTKTISWGLPQRAQGFTDIEVLKENERLALLPLEKTEFHDESFSLKKRYKVRALKMVSITHKLIKETTANGQIRNILKWKRPDDLYLGEQYEIWRTAKQGEYEPIGLVQPGITLYKDSTIKDGVRYYYKVAAIKGATRTFSKPSAPLFTIGTAKCLFAQDTPNDEGESFKIQWEPSPNADQIRNYLLLRLVYDSLACPKDLSTFTDTTGKLDVDYRYSVVKTYRIDMPAAIVADSMGLTGRVIRIEWRICPRVIGQDYDLTLIFRAEKNDTSQFQYVDYTAPDQDEFIDGTAEPNRDYIYEARAIKEISIPFQITERIEDKKRITTLVWNRSREPPEFLGYMVSRADRIDGSYSVYARLGPLVNSFIDRVGIFNGVPYAYKLVAVTKAGEEVVSKTTPYVIASGQWFHTGRINALIALVIFIFFVILFIQIAKSGKELFVRRISGLSAVDEAVGRATEMGRPILYVPGTSDISDVSTIASLNILSEVAKKVAQYNTPIIVPNRDPIVFTVAREVVKEAYNRVGRPDAFNPDSVYFVTDSQFAYAAAVDGIMLRERPATNFLVGMFWAEALIMAETGASTGAIQIAGTDAVTQLPFFITACDYTLIGEELYAASAYISKNPTLLSALKSQDYIKLVIVVLVALATTIAFLKLGVPVFNLFNIQ